MSRGSQLPLLAGRGAVEVPQGTSDEWYTPGWAYRPLHALFGFRLDVCATADSAKCQRFYDWAEDGLANPWDAPWFCNPPFSHIEAWAQAALVAATEGQPGVMLLPAWTDRPWWQEVIEPRRDRRGPRREVLVECQFTRRISFGYAGNPDADAAQARRDGAPGPRIYPVFCAFIPPGLRRELCGLIRQYSPEWPR